MRPVQVRLPPPKTKNPGAFEGTKAHRQRSGGFYGGGVALSTPHSLKITIGCHLCLERVKGIEPSSLAWEAKALPLSYTRMPV